MTDFKIGHIGATLFFILLSTVHINGCSRWIGFKTQFLVYPNEIQMPDNPKMIDREILFGSKYSVLIVKMENGKIVPVQHYRPEHTFGNRVWEEEASFEKPQRISSYMIVDDLTNQNGIAVKKDGDNKWKVLWLNDELIKEIRNKKMIKLKPYSELPALF